jgi:hypothetical protein
MRGMSGDLFRNDKMLGRVAANLNRGLSPYRADRDNEHRHGFASFISPGMQRVPLDNHIARSYDDFLRIDEETFTSLSRRVIQLASVNHDSVRGPRFSLDKIETLR